MLMAFLFACSSPGDSDQFFPDAKSLRQSSLVRDGIVPSEFVDILPSSTKDIYYQIGNPDTIAYLKFRLAVLPDDYRQLIAHMDGALESDIARLQPLNPIGADWWDPEKIQADFDQDRYVFRELKIGKKGKVYVAASKMGEVYAWMLSDL